MTTLLQTAKKPDDSIIRALLVSSMICILTFAGLLGLLGVSLIPFALASGMVAVLWLALRYPMAGLTAFLAFMPIYTLAFLLAKFFGPPYIGLLEGFDRVTLLLFTFILWRRNGLKLASPDWFLLLCLGIAVVRFFFSGTVLGLLTDFNFMIAYAAGRVTNLTEQQERVWATRGVWIVAMISVLGMFEVFFIGEAPRTVLYLSAANGGTSGQALDAAFHADQYFGLRESATMFGPLQFAPLCMAALIVWWVYCRKPAPAAMIAGGLICSVTRSAWIGTAVAISVLAVIMGQTKRLLGYGALALALFVAAIPTLGLSDFLLSTKTGDDPSRASHQESLFGGIVYTISHPLGVGPGNIGKFAVREDKNAPGIEDTYLTIGAQYGIPALLCFIAFLISTLRLLWPMRTQLSYAGIGIIFGFGVVMIFAALHDVFPLACWLWFPVGRAIRSAVNGSGRDLFMEQTVRI